MLDNELSAGIDAAIAELANLSNAEAEAEAQGPKPKKARKATKSADEVKAANAEPAPSAPVLEGFALNEGADVEAIRKDTEDAAKASDAINRKDADLLGSYLALGRFNSEASRAFKSTKLFGQYVAKMIPSSAHLDASIRSNCKWLYEALNDPAHDAYGKLLGVLGVNDIASYKSGNPTVIRRDFTKIVKEADAKAKAEALGIEGDDPVKALAGVERAEAKQKLTEQIEEAMGILEEKLSESKQPKAIIAKNVTYLVAKLIGLKPEDALEVINAFRVDRISAD